nr:MAG TPA: Protein of unknown function (DUF551) [Bacteriophage sp.]
MQGMQELEGERKMERLTQWVDDGEKRFAIPRVDIRNMGHEKCCNRLAEYEDTGMTPEQVIEMQMEWAAMKAAHTRWIPVTERLPEDESYILVSFENCTSPDIAWYKEDEEGGAFYLENDEYTYIQYGLFVNAWMPLPELYKEDKQ